MLNPEAVPLQACLIYEYDHGLNESWNMKEYKTPKIYQDPKLEVLKRKWESQKKGQKTDKYITKRGFYMDYHIKVQNSIPSSTEHINQNPWSFQKEIKKSEHIKVDQSLNKNTYIEQIINQQFKRKKPGVGTYSLEKSMQQKQLALEKLKQKVIPSSNKRYFYEDTQHVSERIPGAGNYNPHESVSRIKKNRTDLNFWLKKHEKQFKRDQKRDLIRPNPASYSPVYRSFNTFDLKKQNQMLDLKKKNGFGSDARFSYVRPNRKVIKQVRPSPGTYDTGINWRGKNSNEKKKYWHQAIYKGSMTESIYKSK